MQVILGAGGDIGKLLAKELMAYTDQVRLVARNPKRVNDNDELVSANLLDKDAVMKAVEGATVAYLTVGLKYDVDVWTRDWPVIMQNVIGACLAHHCKLVFFDNVYLYDRSAIPHMRENSPVNPPSRKGKVRKQIVDMLENAQARGLRALIARSADFYGPGARNGILNILVINNLKKGKRANWQADLHKIHSITFTPDAAKATALLGNTDHAYQQVWHLPTSAERLTGKEFIALTAEVANAKPAHFLLTPWRRAVFGLFTSQIRELKEMQYQNTQDYFFDSEKFNQAFQFTPTSYRNGILQTVNSI